MESGTKAHLYDAFISAVSCRSILGSTPRPEDDSIVWQIRLALDGLETVQQHITGALERVDKLEREDKQ